MYQQRVNGICVSLTQQKSAGEMCIRDSVMYFLKAAEPYVDTIQISSGIDKIFEANIHCITTNMEETMPNLKWAKEVRKQLHVPISLVSAITTPQMAEEILAKGYVDLVAFGRSLLADPYWPKKAQEGCPEDIVPCLRCSNCCLLYTSASVSVLESVM